MPIPTDADQWTDADQAEQFRDRVLDHLADHPDQAFHTYELTDELLGTSWGDYFKRERIIAEVGEDEYYENQDGYDDEHGIEASGFSGPYNASYRLHLLGHLDALAGDGQVEMRKIPVEETDVPVESWEEIRFCTYAGD